MAEGMSRSDGVAAASGGAGAGWLQRATRARPDEIRASLWAFACFFALLAAYYVLRPIRDEMAIQIGQARLHEVFTLVFVAMLVAAPVFGWLTGRFPRRRLLPWLYGFFIVNLLAFFVVFEAGGTQSGAVARTFFVWVSVFNLFAVSLFWSLLADIFATSQAQRLYGFIAAGGTAGALAGPSLTAGLVTLVGAKGMVLVSAALLGVVIVAVLELRRWAQRTGAIGAGEPKEPLAGGVWSGITDLVRSPYLLGICLFLFLYSLLSTFLYFQQAELVPAAISDSAERTRLLALVDLAVNVLALLIQLLAFGTLMRRLGTTFMLAAMPVVAMVGFALLALHPGLATLVAFGITRRAGEYAISKPARETLFNALPPEQKYKAKNVIDTLVHRFGDTSSSWIFAGLKGLGLSLTAVSWIAVPIAGAWLGTALAMGRAAARRRGDAA
jgi:ATP:ADP antiporter, AAA family